MTNKIQSGDLFKLDGVSYECIGTDDGFIWYEIDSQMDSVKADPGDCVLTHKYLENISVTDHIPDTGEMMDEPETLVLKNHNAQLQSHCSDLVKEIERLKDELIEKTDKLKGTSFDPNFINYVLNERDIYLLFIKGINEFKDIDYNEEKILVPYDLMIEKIKSSFAAPANMLAKIDFLQKRGDSFESLYNEQRTL